MIEKIKRYFFDTLWNFHLSEEKGWRHFRLKWLRIAFLALRGFYQDKCSLGASSLTYYTIMSVVPLLAMAVAVARGFGYYERFRLELLNRFPDQKEAFSELFKYADSFLEQARNGLIAGIGLAILFLTVALLLSNLEGILNHIWGVKSLRSWKRMLSDYFALMLIAPIFFVLASSMTVFIVEYLEIGIRALPIARFAVSWLLFLVNIIPYCLFWILFTFIYLFMPNTRVRFRSAAIAGLFAGCLYLILQWGYIYFQIHLSRYGAIYGSMAALPLFLIWTQLSWFLLLFGAEISSAHQRQEEHEFEGKVGKMSNHFRRLMSLWIAHLAMKRGCISLDLLIQRYQIPKTLSLRILEELVRCQILYETKQGYVPAQQAFEMRISECIGILETKGENEFPFIDSKNLAAFEAVLDDFRKNIELSPKNVRLSHVSHSL